MSEVSPTSAVPAGINRSLMVRVIIVSVVMLVGVVIMNALEKSMHLTFDKPPMPLRKPLAQLKTQLGPRDRYVAFEADSRLDADEIDTLGTTKYLLRNYTDVTRKAGEVGSVLTLNLNYYDTGSAAPHVPEICWAGNGHVESTNSRVFFTVHDVPHRDGTVSDLRMRMISFEPTQNERLASVAVSTDPESHLKNVAYLFEVNGKYVASPDEVRSSFWKASNKYAYDTKIEVTVSELCTQEQAQAAIGDFVRAAIPQIEECLPDSSLLNEAPAPSPPVSPVNVKSSNPQ